MYYYGPSYYATYLYNYLGYYYAYDYTYNYYLGMNPYRNQDGKGPSVSKWVAITFAIILGLIVTCVCSCIGYFWCTKTIVIDGRLVRRCACCDKCRKDSSSRSMNAMQVCPAGTVIPNLRVGQDGLVYHVDEFNNPAPMQLQSYSPA